MKRFLLGIYKIIVKILTPMGVGKIPFVRKIRNAVISRLNPKVVEVLGHTMYLDEIDTLSLSFNKIYEPFETEYFQELIKEGDVILDIGANIGYYTLLFARQAGETGKVYAFEPDPTNFALLKKNIEVNGYKNVELINKAVTDHSGSLKLFLCEENRGDHRTYDSSESRKSVDVPCVSIDDYFKNKKVSIDLIKMDIQGAEGYAVKGMKSTLKDQKKMKVVTEFWPYGLNKAGSKADEYLDAFTKNGFSIKEFNEDKKQLEEISADTLLKNFSIDRLDATNLQLEK